MEDIDDLIVALRVEGDRANALARLTGNEEDAQRDTLAVLKGSQREAAIHHQDAHRLPKELPPKPKGEDTEYAANDNTINGDDERRLNKWIKEQRQQAVPIVSRWSTWSAGSSTCSEDTEYTPEPLSLYYDDSRSTSRASATRPDSPFTQYCPSQPDSVHGPAPLWSLDPMKPSTNNPSFASSRTNSPMRQLNPHSNSPMHFSNSRPSSPMHQPPPRSLSPAFAMQCPYTPTIPTHGSRNPSPEPRGRSRNHLHPMEDWRPNIDTTPILHRLRPVPSSSQVSIASSNKSTVTTAAQENMMNGRPCKDNNYWGFCKGAWATREDADNGLVLTTRPEGLFNTSQVWKCRHCLFEGHSGSVPHPTQKNKKEVVLNPKIYTSEAGIRYRWSFLAKSHVRKVNYSSSGRSLGEEAECNYGCVVCSVEGTVTGVYGSVEMLMNHIAEEHVWTGYMSFATMARSKIVVGKTAGSEEEWDVNIPNAEGLRF